MARVFLKYDVVFSIVSATADRSNLSFQDPMLFGVQQGIGEWIGKVELLPVTP